jgi:hypothetical protein
MELAMKMAKKPFDNRSLKEFAIDVLETAYMNLLQTLWGIKPDVWRHRLILRLIPFFGLWDIAQPIWMDSFYGRRKGQQ